MSSRSDRQSIAHELAELRSVVDRLAEHVQVLTAALDELTDELQWRNNQIRENEPLPSPFVLKSMPLDPASRNWRINQHSPEPASTESTTPPRSGRQTLFD